MKLIVDKIPEKPEECLFAKCSFSGYLCNLRDGNICLMSKGKNCRYLVEISDVALMRPQEESND